MKVVVDRERCQGHGRCYDRAPDVFAADEDGYVVLLIDLAEGPDLVAQAETAVRNCPERALALEPGNAEGVGFEPTMGVTP